ncbi:MAG: ATP-binding cassette domain-containing protein, partial [Comamonas sp.]
MPLLEVTGLNLFLRGSQGTAQALRHLSFKLERGRSLGIIGESGSGKSLTVQTLMGLQPEQATVTGSILWNGQELLGQSESQWQAMRGNRMAMVFQEPMTALNPVHTVGRQVAEPLRRHKGLDAKAALHAAITLLERVGIPNASVRASDYPHQFSGGQRQRITIAMALACE